MRRATGVLDQSLVAKFDLIRELYFRIKNSGLLVLGFDSLNVIYNAV